MEYGDLFGGALDIESAVIGALLLEGRIAPAVREQLSSDIFSARRRPITRAILATADQTGVCDIVAVADELDRMGHGGIEMNQELARLAGGVATSANLEGHIKRLRERAEAGGLDDDSLLARCGITRLRPGDDLEHVEDALRRLVGLLDGADPLRRATLREAVIQKLEALKIRAPSRLVDAALTANQSLPTTDKAGRPIVFSDPDPWPEPVDGADLVEEIGATLRRFAVLPEGAADALALWVVHTYAVDEARISPLAALVSPVRRCGKTLVLELLSLVVRRPLAAASITAAAVFRAIETYSPTLLIDEADAFLRDNDELRGVLNSGHTRATAFVLRVVGDEHEPRAFSTWCAKAIALIGSLPPTLEDRAILIPMRRRARAEHVERFRRDRGAVVFEALRRRIARWVNDNREVLRHGDPDVPDALHDRAADNWRPLFAIADVTGSRWPDAARRAALRLAGETEEADGTGVQLLADLRDLFGRKGTDRLGTEEILEELGKLAERPWPTYNRGGKPITARQLARLLRPFDIASRTIRVDEGTAKGYMMADLEDALSRYLPGEGPDSPVLSVTTAQPAPGAGETPISYPSQPPLVTDKNRV